MNKHIPTILAAIICIVLAGAAVRGRMQTADLERRLERNHVQAKALEQANAEITAANTALREALEKQKRENFDFSTDLHDNENMDMSPGRFSGEKLRQFAEDMERLNRGMIGRAESLLTAEQLAVFRESVEAIAQMQNSQLEMAGNMFRERDE